ncbi:helix-turn-helix transcriptional regulator [Peribacillus psychrosaccharolyticus]|uniref:Helix-turn-helix transcriptional regulator n=1 Tax=Peribacillus psychrosaccharolyticus TaxID=1407 RepID=A0A974S339_PERPY|nr:helix-turn-helix transcriptional regulator [Peribacillus psychrosaccharolyticus]
MGGCYGLVNKIKELRIKHGDTLKNLAQKINYDYSYLSKIERGMNTPSLPLLKKIADVYEVDITYLIKIENKYTSAEQRFMHDIDTNLEDLAKKYNLSLDGQEITPKEMEFMIEVIRKLRFTFQKDKD